MLALFLCFSGIRAVLLTPTLMSHVFPHYYAISLNNAVTDRKNLCSNLSVHDLVLHAYWLVYWQARLTGEKAYAIPSTQKSWPLLLFWTRPQVALTLLILTLQSPDAFRVKSFTNHGTVGHSKCFVDLEKTFDFIIWYLLWEAQWEYGVSGLLLCVLQSLYEFRESCVQQLFSWIGYEDPAKVGELSSMGG